MVPREQILKSFFRDTLRLVRQADECLKNLEDQAGRGSRLSAAQVRSFYQSVHTIKGTAAMLATGAKVVEALEKVEGLLACQPLTESALRVDWLPLARKGLDEAAQALEWLRKRESFRRAQGEVRSTRGTAGLEQKPSLGLAVLAHWGNRLRLLWFQGDEVQRVLAGNELAGRRVFEVGGEWVPVLGYPDSGKGRPDFFGVIVSVGGVEWVLASPDVLGWMSWEQAQTQGAETSTILLPPARPGALRKAS